MRRYNPKEIEPKWQKYWDDHQTYKADLDSNKPKYISMSMFNYPSGAGIHIGHAMNYTISDVLARFKRQQGYESYHPVGWDSFGLPAENYAIKAGVSPQQSMATIIPNYHKQYKAMGWSNDWSKEIATHTPEYYKWTQWIFSQMYRDGLAYQDSRMQWWCTKCQTVLANEQVIDGKCWRHDSPEDPEVAKREVKQWFFKITDYADELLEATDDLDWTESVKLAQKNWIGKSVGAEVDFAVDGSKKVVKVFTTRPDTLFGATFLVLAPEHPLVDSITTQSQKTAVETYVKQAQRKSDVERQAEKQKTGVFTGGYAINPANDQKVPIWIADYVLMGYGTGAIMAVPAHDERDYEFANKFDLPIRQVIAGRFVHTDNDHRDDAPIVSREVVCGVVKHPKEDNFLIAKPVGSDFWSPVMGGIDGGESPEQAIRRELVEESGYTDIRSTKTFDQVLSSEFFAQHKKENRIAYVHTVLVELGSMTKVEVSQEEQGQQELKWVSRAEVSRLCVGAGAKQIYEIAEGIAQSMVTEGRLINSGKYDGLFSWDARENMVVDLMKTGVASEKVNFKMRDWSVSRQRYWGAPIPIIYCPDHGPVLVPDKDLPVVLPELTDFQPSGDGRSALARATDWVKADCPTCGKPGERETDTLDTYIDSSWYMLRYFDGQNDKEIFDSKVVNKWMPIDFYNGADHATAHMIYARFITRFFNKKGLVDNPEPFKKFLFNGKVVNSDGSFFSKSKGVVIDPRDIINQGYGADALRTYLMFAAPLELWTRWDPQGVPGAYRFLSRIWALTGEFLDAKEGSKSESTDVLKTIHRTIQKVTDDLDQQKYNTAIAALMQCTNDLYKLKTKGFGDKADWQFALDSLVSLVAPFAPHTAEELWHDLGHGDSVQVDHWPQYDKQYIVSDSMTIVVQVNGKVRANVQANTDASEEDLVKLAKADENVAKYLDKKEVRKTIYVPQKLINFVV